MSGYDVALSFTVKAHPNADMITVQRLEIAPRAGNTSGLLDAVAILFQNYPSLNDAGYAGITPIFGNTSVGYYHDFRAIGKSVSEAKEAFVPIRREFEKLNNLISINETYKFYTDYWSMYEAKFGLHDPVGVETALTSRLFDRASVSSFEKVCNYVSIASGNSEEYTSNVILLVSGGQVAKDAADPYTGLNPGMENIVVKVYVRNNITNVKGAAQKAIAPHTGGYMNEGDQMDPEWKQSAYGANYEKNSRTKRKYEPEGFFYCPTCVGSGQWVDRPETPLCRA